MGRLTLLELLLIILIVALTCVFYSHIKMSDDIAIMISSISMVIAFFTLVSQKRTEKNTLPIFSKKSQEIEFRILVRFLLKNFVQSTAIWLKLEEKHYTHYPSEVYITEQTINIDNLHLQLFYNNPDITPLLSKLMISLNKYNSSIKVVAQHLSNPQIPIETKRDEIQRFQIVGVFDLLDELKIFLSSAYPNKNICSEEIVVYFHHWEEEARIQEAFGLNIGDSFDQFKQHNKKTFNRIGNALNNLEFRLILHRMGVNEQNCNTLINNIALSIASQLVGHNMSLRPIMIRPQMDGYKNLRKDNCNPNS